MKFKSDNIEEPNEEIVDNKTLDTSEADGEENKEDKKSKSNQISNKLGEMLNVQKDNELYNFNLYNRMSNWFKIQGLSKLAEYYTARADEEKHHHDWIINRLRQCNYPIEYEFIDSSKETWNDNLKPFDITVEQEYKTTESISKIVKQAMEECDFKLMYWLLKIMISEQHEEEYISETIKDIANLDTDWITKEQSIYDIYFNNKEDL